MAAAHGVHGHASRGRPRPLAAHLALVEVALPVLLHASLGQLHLLNGRCLPLHATFAMALVPALAELRALHVCLSHVLGRLPILLVHQPTVELRLRHVLLFAWIRLGVGCCHLRAAPSGLATHRSWPILTLTRARCIEQW